MMIMEAMRLSLLDHEEHQRKSAAEQAREQQSQQQGASSSQGAAQAAPAQSSTSQAPAGVSTPTSPTGPTPSSSRRSSNAAGTMASWRASSTEGSSHHNGHNGHGHGRAQAAASKLLSKITVNRSRANSKSSVHFAASPTTMGSGSSSSSGPGPSSAARARSASASVPSTQISDHHPSPLGASSLGPASRRSLDVNATRRQPSQLVSDVDSINEFAAGPSRPTPERSTSDLIDMGGEEPATETPPTPPDVDEPTTPRINPQPNAEGPSAATANVAQAPVEEDTLDVPDRRNRNSIAESFDSRSSFAASYTDPVPSTARSKPLAAMADDD